MFVSSALLQLSNKVIGRYKRPTVDQKSTQCCSVSRKRAHLNIQDQNWAFGSKKRQPGKFGTSHKLPGDGFLGGVPKPTGGSWFAVLPGWRRGTFLGDMPPRQTGGCRRFPRASPGEDQLRCGGIENHAACCGMLTLHRYTLNPGYILKTS